MSNNMATLAKERWTESRVAGLLEKRFPAPAYCFLRQVRNGTGFGHGRIRTADALAVSCYPSRGLYITGIEIKVSNSDWKKELALPNKSESIQQYCRHWFVAAPKGLIEPAEVPASWGLIECNAKGTRVVKNAPKLEPVPPDMAFVCSVLRNVNESHVPAKFVSDKINAASKSIWEDAKKDADRRSKDLKAAVEEFEKASGVSLQNRWMAGDIGGAVKVVMDAGEVSAIRQSLRMAERHERMAEQHEAIAAQIRKAAAE